MNHTMKFLSFLVGLMLTFSTQAGEIGHFAPGVPSIRDFAMPEPGLYGLVYNYGYGPEETKFSGKINKITLEVK